MYHERSEETTALRSELMPHPRRHLWACALSAALLIALAVGLAWRARAPWFAAGAGALALLGLWRPRLGALAVLALATPDLIGSVELGRFTLRASQVAALGVALGALARQLGQGSLRRTLGQVPAPLWLMVGFAVLAGLRVALTEVPNPGKGLAYAVWALFASAVVAGGQWAALEHREDVARGLRVVVIALAAIATFGLLQWTVGALGCEPPLVTQWMDGLPRINGLSYEPSYFAFSTVAGLALALVAVLERPSFLAPLPAALAGAVMVTALVLASSRSGWLALMLISAIAAPLALRRWRSLVAAQRPALGVLLLGYALGFGLLASTQLDSYTSMARRGLDVEEPSSSAPRLEGVRQALAMFRARPLLGVGLGQFGGALAELRGQELPAERMDQLVTFNLYVELLAENGVVGTGLVLAALLLVLRASLRGWRRGEPGDRAVAGALLLAGGLLFGVMYQFNQTLFRTDVWCLIGLALAASRVAAPAAGERAA